MERRDPSVEGRFTMPDVCDALEKLPASHPEAAYRRGYADGWAGAIDAMRMLMFQDGLSSRAAHDACWNHWRNALFEWYDQSSKEAKPEGMGAAYRRGYRDGWAEGTDAMWDLIFASGKGRHVSYGVCRDHWRDQLCEWAQGDYTKMVVPPVLARKRA